MFKLFFDSSLSSARMPECQRQAVNRRQVHEKGPIQKQTTKVLVEVKHHSREFDPCLEPLIEILATAGAIVLGMDHKQFAGRTGQGIAQVVEGATPSQVAMGLWPQRGKGRRR